ncbi:MAG: HAD-IB family hydrolase [Candidatus Staskawiczbacteria bacterium]|nr:HAD-IB family hydrolase [Candidatus Staskawiczbacteria bacterium]
MQQKVAIFDIDGTIFRSSLLIEVTDALIAEGLFPESIKKVYAQSYKNWHNRKDSYEKYIGDVVRAFDKNLVKISQKDFARVAKKVVALKKNKVYRYTRDLVKELKGRGYFMLAISHSPRELVFQFAKNLGFDKVYGRVHEVNQQGKFTGKTLYLDQINNKAVILQRAIEAENLTLKGSVAVGDSDGDIPMLSIVDRPICFNPNSKLHEKAKKEGWKVVVERKDVIYLL